MDYGVFAKAIELSEYLHVDRIVISGGEPFLYWKTICEYLERHPIKNTMRFSLCTNGYWAQNSGELKRTLQELRYYNFDALEISTDTFHQEYVNFEECIAPLITDAISHGFHTDITVCYKDIIRESSTIKRIQQIITNRGSLHLRPIANFGRAKENMISAPLLCAKEQICTVVGEMCVRYDGHCFICCGPPIVHDIPEFFAGNVLTDSFQSIEKAYKTNRTIDAMRSGAFSRMYSECRSDNLCSKCIGYSVGNMLGSYDEKGESI